jgi:hypothetical protein
LHDGDVVGKRECFLLVVRDVETRQAAFALDAAQFDSQVVTQPGVEVGQRLIEQQHARRHGHRPGQRNALHLSTREEAGAAVGQMG